MSTTTPTIQILPGYRPGILGHTLDMHMDFYSPLAGWGVSFEAGLACALGPLLKRLDGMDVIKDPQKFNKEATDGEVTPPRGRNQVWSAVQTQDQDQDQAQGNKKKDSERIVGVVYVNGDYYRMGEHKEEGGEEVCRLQCLIVDDEVRGLGVGRKLFAAAMAFVKEAGFRECRLTTSRELKAARRLYERGGFVVVEEKNEEYVRDDDGRQQVFERMEYVWRRDGSGGDVSEETQTDTGMEVAVG
ncbi:acyl-CoA N-acyltransferase [Pseudoneurospora amorphoporcata]|uniref:Acyl-CoA N-acyltransferase n=1 Tax=Pseudoneurospora amorphoporcata TaxID=241081 RepID=A0AAN6NRD1_9PEZI|nr:acyl-CoA N-acyltransferase [Pseudoneurospora amorphoporcata]